MPINMQLKDGLTTPGYGIWRQKICMSSHDILVIQTAIINRFILVVVKSANVGYLGVAKAFSEELNSSLTISTLACSGKLSSDKTQQLFTIVSTCCISLN